MMMMKKAWSRRVLFYLLHSTRVYFQIRFHRKKMTMVMMTTKTKTTKTMATVGRRRCRNSNSIVLLVSIYLGLFLFLHSSVTLCHGHIACTDDSECEIALRLGSKCGTNGLCTNPFHYGGCLKNYISGDDDGNDEDESNNNNKKFKWKRIRICSSDDPPDAHLKGYCRLPTLFDDSSSSQDDDNYSYGEVRIASQNWESVFFQAWILQIILSELLDVPVSIETGIQGRNANLYSEQLTLDYGTANDGDALLRANEVGGDCRILHEQEQQQQKEGEEYKSCAHVIPELWRRIEDLSAGVATTHDIGALGEQHWFVPKFTAAQDLTLLSHMGLQGPENRRKLAETFLRPTTWKDYCDLVSINDCETDDGIASRRPQNEGEEQSMFVYGMYTGHFRFTDDNDCDTNPFTCTGHIADWPCEWTSYAVPLTHHLDIALKSNGNEASGGYTYSQLNQIWAAANATKSNVLMEWWFPEQLYQAYTGTDAEFTRVTLPIPTQTCAESRIALEDRCADNFETRVGNPQGACDYKPLVLQKVIASSLYDQTHDPNIPEALWSPAYDAILNFRITDLQLNEILDDWLTLDGNDPNHFDPRDATCRWVVENLELIQSMLPPNYPRTIQEEDLKTDPVFRVSIAVAILAICCVGLSTMKTYHQRRKRIIRVAPIHFLSLMLFAMFLLSMAALVLSLPPTDETCITYTWFVNLAFSIQLVAIVAKMSAIYKLSASGKGMQYVQLGWREFFGPVLALVCVAVTLLVIYTLMDIDRKYVEYHLTDKVTPTDETIISAVSYCGTESDTFSILSLALQSIFLLWGIMLAFLTSRVTDDRNDTRAFAKLIYTHFAFLCLRIIWLLVGDSIRGSSSHMMGFLSIIYSAECIAALIVYFLPKFVEKGVVEDDDASEPLPDLYLNTTIMYADVAGFTAWSSMREPAQVFRFLETIYHEFDAIAERSFVFKVETVADRYVAACGLPQPRSDHVVVMAKFARNCMAKMNTLTKKLDIIFGPDTGDLSLRVGIHSGPVTGGFLKGKGARFQLFGDTMNTTALIEKSGERGRIHVSEDTANLLIKSGKKRWVGKRDAKIDTKGKGELQTYWLNTKRRRSRRRISGPGEASSHFSSGGGDSTGFDVALDDDMSEAYQDRTTRLIEYNATILLRLLKQIVARRDMTTDKDAESRDDQNRIIVKDAMPLEEVKEIITLPEFDIRTERRQRGVEDVEIPDLVVEQLRCHVKQIALRYRNNSFHNFDHASHVVTSVIKHMNRIVAPSALNSGGEDEKQTRKSEAAATLHDHTYGITSDPLTQFACVYSALIHDVDHPGVPNPRFIEEDPEMASTYKGRSVAEQNSFDIAWMLLMEGRYKDLRSTLCCDTVELSRFRQLVINSVMATDLGDKELKALRNGRWDRAFQEKTAEKGPQEESPLDDVNRKATIVIEHLIQASDVSHTMQHWHIYTKWNRKLFLEMYSAFKEGRAEKNPADFWYEGELGFFDFYIIPLAKKLKDCGVFGISSDENLNYAQKNRSEWEKRGREVVAEMVELVQRDEDDSDYEDEDDDLADNSEVEIVFETLKGDPV